MPSRDKKWKLAIKLFPFNLNKLAGRGGGGGGGAMIEAPDNLGQFTPITIGLGSGPPLGHTGHHCEVVQSRRRPLREIGTPTKIIIRDGWL